MATMNQILEELPFRYEGDKGMKILSLDDDVDLFLIKLEINKEIKLKPQKEKIRYVVVNGEGLICYKGNPDGNERGVSPYTTGKIHVVDQTKELMFSTFSNPMFLLALRGSVENLANIHFGKGDIQGQSIGINHFNESRSVALGKLYAGRDYGVCNGENHTHPDMELVTIFNGEGTFQNGNDEIHYSNNLTQYRRILIPKNTPHGAAPKTDTYVFSVMVKK